MFRLNTLEPFSDFGRAFSSLRCTFLKNTNLDFRRKLSYYCNFLISKPEVLVLVSCVLVHVYDCFMFVVLLQCMYCFLLVSCLLLLDVIVIPPGRWQRAAPC